jgi:hypothetical protein
MTLEQGNQATTKVRKTKKKQAHKQPNHKEPNNTITETDAQADKWKTHLEKLVSDQQIQKEPDTEGEIEFTDEKNARRQDIRLALCHLNKEYIEYGKNIGEYAATEVYFRDTSEIDYALAELDPDHGYLTAEELAGPVLAELGASFKSARILRIIIEEMLNDYTPPFPLENNLSFLVGIINALEEAEEQLLGSYKRECEAQTGQNKKLAKCPEWLTELLEFYLPYPCCELRQVAIEKGA